MDKCLVFTAESEYARFRKPYTTTSALTYTTIHPVAAKGLLGAVIGIDRDKLYEYGKDLKIAIQVLKPIRKDMQSFKLLTMKTSENMLSFPSNVEFLRDVKYKVYVTGNDDKIIQASEIIKNRNFEFTPYLGCSEHIAKLQYMSVESVEFLKEGKYDVNSLIPSDKIKLDTNEDIFKVNMDNIPIENNEKREYIKYEKILFSTGSNTLKGYVDGIYRVGDKNVFFL